MRPLDLEMKCSTMFQARLNRSYDSQPPTFVQRHPSCLTDSSHAPRTQHSLPKPSSTHLTHSDSRLDPTRDRINAASQPEQIQALVLFTDRVRGVYPCAFGVALSKGLCSVEQVGGASRDVNEPFRGQ